MSTLVKENRNEFLAFRNETDQLNDFFWRHRIKGLVQISKKIIPNCSDPATWARTSGTWFHNK